MELVKVLWEESEQGWGVRPDGYSLHRNSEDAKAFVNEYWDRMPNNVPEEYSRPVAFGMSIAHTIVSVEQVIYNTVIESKNGVRFYT